MTRSNHPRPKFGSRPPPKGWNEGDSWVHQFPIEISAEQLCEIAARLEVPETSEHLDTVRAALGRYHGREKSLAEQLAGDHRARDQKHLTAFADALEGMRPQTLGSLERYGVAVGEIDPIQWAAAARERAAVIESERARLPKRNRPPATSRAVLLCELGTIYTAATGRPAKVTKSEVTGKPSGRFFAFLRAAIAPLPLAKIRDAALAQAAKRALSE